MVVDGRMIDFALAQSRDKCESDISGSLFGAMARIHVGRTKNMHVDGVVDYIFQGSKDSAVEKTTSVVAQTSS